MCCFRSKASRKDLLSVWTWMDEFGDSAMQDANLANAYTAIHVSFSQMAQAEACVGMRLEHSATNLSLGSRRTMSGQSADDV